MFAQTTIRITLGSSETTTEKEETSTTDQTTNKTSENPTDSTLETTTGSYLKIYLDKLKLFSNNQKRHCQNNQNFFGEDNTKNIREKVRKNDEKAMV